MDGSTSFASVKNRARRFAARRRDSVDAPEAPRSPRGATPFATRARVASRFVARIDSSSPRYDAERAARSSRGDATTRALAASARRRESAMRRATRHRAYRAFAAWISFVERTREDADASSLSSLRSRFSAWRRAGQERVSSVLAVHAAFVARGDADDCSSRCDDGAASSFVRDWRDARRRGGVARRRHARFFGGSNSRERRVSRASRDGEDDAKATFRASPRVARMDETRRRREGRGRGGRAADARGGDARASRGVASRDGVSRVARGGGVSPRQVTKTRRRDALR